MPRKWVELRAPSHEATCPRILEEFTDRDGTLKAWRCGAEMRLNLTVSPLPEYRELVTQTCLAGHVVRVQGVLEWIPEVWAEDGPVGL